MPLGSKEEVEIIIAAAGLSSRMGDWKPGMIYKGKPLIYHALQAAIETDWPVTIVGGHHYSQLEKLIDKFTCDNNDYLNKIKLIFNSEYLKGLGESFFCGITVSSAEWIFLSLGDLPLISCKTYQDLFIQKETTACRPFYQNRPGHPVLIHKSEIPKIKMRHRNITTVKKEISMKNLMGIIHPIDWTDPAVIKDIDNPKALLL